MTVNSQAVHRSLRRMGLAGDGDRPELVALTGGVSSDIWRAQLADGPVCIKRALPQLRVAAEWRAPVSRNASEVGWIEVAQKIVPGSAPRLLGHDAGAGMFAMEYCDPARYLLWKTELLEERIDLKMAAAVGDTLGRIHAATADDPEVADRFANDRIFYDIRLEPYLIATGLAHPDRAEALGTLAQTTANTKRVLVHGDVSPKNILLGPEQPVFIDAECAWYGDPAFDLGFCLNHLLLKCLWAPGTAPGYLASFDALAASYLANVTWENRADLESRVAHLLPGLLLARIDGKSPVEYLTEDDSKNCVRRLARDLLDRPVARLDALRDAWRDNLPK